jgi:hypothetical protein
VYNRKTKKNIEWKWEENQRRKKSRVTTKNGFYKRIEVAYSSISRLKPSNKGCERGIVKEDSKCSVTIEIEVLFLEKKEREKYQYWRKYVDIIHSKDTSESFVEIKPKYRLCISDKSDNSEKQENKSKETCLVSLRNLCKKWFSTSHEERVGYTKSEYSKKNSLFKGVLVSGIESI